VRLLAGRLVTPRPPLDALAPAPPVFAVLAWPAAFAVGAWPAALAAGVWPATFAILARPATFAVVARPAASVVVASPSTFAELAGPAALTVVARVAGFSVVARPAGFAPPVGLAVLGGRAGAAAFGVPVPVFCRAWVVAVFVPAARLPVGAVVDAFIAVDPFVPLLVLGADVRRSALVAALDADPPPAADPPPDTEPPPAQTDVVDRAVLVRVVAEGATRARVPGEVRGRGTVLARRRPSATIRWAARSAKAAIVSAGAAPTGPGKTAPSTT
jgi:hypothetical protein